MPIHDYLPPDVPRAQVAAAVALLSDTHMPQRSRGFPPALFSVLAGADLLLHAGDVGELWALEQLSAISPVVAVHGNDDSRAAQETLPYSTLVPVRGQRVFLWHSHYPNWQDERDSRRGEEILPKLERTVTTARAAGASLAVFGHWHIPLLFDAGDLLVVNPGAIASGNEITRQLRQTVATAFLLHSGAWRVAHVDLAAPHAPYDATVDWNAGFGAALARYSDSIVEPSLSADMPWLMANTPPVILGKLRRVVLALAHEVWSGERPLLTYERLAQEASLSPLLDEDERAQVEQLLATRPGRIFSP